jgi:hypothetical protein
MTKALDRTVGFYPISIATSLALEGVFHTGEFDNPTAKDFPLRGKLLLVNIRTLFRNAYNAFTSQEQMMLDIKPIYDSVKEDILEVFTAVSRSEPECTVEFYYCTYSDPEKHLGALNFYNRGVDTEDHKATPKQKHYRELEKDLFLNLSELLEELPDSIVVNEYDFYIETKKPTVLLTHYPADLLSEDKMPSVVLLESHTGKLKGKSEWASKLYNKPTNIPFSKMMLAVFGDGVMIAPQPIKFRKKLLELGAKYKWDHRTTDTRIIEGVKFAKEPHLVTFLRKLK